MSTLGAQFRQNEPDFVDDTDAPDAFEQVFLGLVGALLQVRGVEAADTLTLVVKQQKRLFKTVRRALGSVVG
jgi:hypothetical protein